jgi:shikimate 5-dehydrogenase
VADLVRRAAVLGSPIGHSLSPALHRAAYRDLGLPWEYDAIEVTAEELPGFIAGLGPDWAGLSLTMPLKTAVLPLLVDRTSSVVLTGSANTVVLGADGPTGANTDVAGIVEAVREHATEALATARTATILGNGATARSALAALDALAVRSAVVVARRPGETDDLRRLAEAVGVALRVEPWDSALDHLGADLVVSTVPSGVADALAGAVAGPADGGPGANPAAAAIGAVAGRPPRLGVLLDVVYDPWPSALVTAWQGRGAPVVPGHAMLLHQAAHQVELMTGGTAPLAAMRAALAAALPA